MLSSTDPRYQPPAVVWAAGPGWQVAAVPWVVACGLIGMLAIWLGWREGLDVGLLCAVVAACAAVAVFECRSPSVRRLEWNRREWSLVRAAQGTDRPDALLSSEPCRLQIPLDLQVVLLVRAMESSTKRVHWLWLAQGSNPLAWHRLRCAVFGSGQP